MNFKLTLADCLEPLNALLYGDNATVSGVSINSRTINKGELYIAIVGERFDGHDFVAAAIEAGAAAIMVHQQIDVDIPTLVVDDTRTALGQLGKYWAQRFAIPTIAVTGSNGKTTVKELITRILQQQGPVLFTRGNLNNELGVPLTLLGMRSEHNYAVIEMGANHAGEIAQLAAFVEPDVAVVTNIGTAHLEGFGSEQGIANAKSEIFAALKPSAYGVINMDDAYKNFMLEACSHCLVRGFGKSVDADVRLMPDNNLVISSMGETLTLRFRLVGEHNAMNAAAAVAAVNCLDIQNDSVIKGLEAIMPVPGRLEKKAGVRGAAVIDDSYNANPDSVKSAVDVLCTCTGKRFLVLGDMAELGPGSEAMHVQVGEYAHRSGIDALWTIGALTVALQKAFNRSNAKNPQALGGHFDNHDELAVNLCEYLDDDVTVLVKGSRSARMELVVEALVDSPAMTPSTGSTL